MKAHTSKAKRGVGLETNQSASLPVQNQQVVNMVQQPVQAQKMYTTFSEFFDDHMKDLKKCKVDNDRETTRR